MKKIVSLLICLSLCLTAFSACGKKSSTSAAASSGAESTASAVPPSVSSAPTVQSESTAASSSVSSEIAPVDGHKVSASIQVANENRLGVLTLTVPETWTYDNYATFTQDNIKVADLAALWKTENPSIPFTVEMTDGFAHPESGDGPQYPEGFGLQQTLDRTVGGHLTRTYLYKTWPSDANTEWYAHYTFFVLDGYVVQIHFYTFSESDDDALFDSIISSAQLTFAS